MLFILLNLHLSIHHIFLSNKLVTFLNKSSLLLLLIPWIIHTSLLIFLKLMMKISNKILSFRLLSFQYFILHPRCSLIQLFCTLINNIIFQRILLYFSLFPRLIPNIKCLLVVKLKIFFSPFIKLLQSFSFNLLIFSLFFPFRFYNFFILNFFLIVFIVFYCLSFF